MSYIENESICFLRNLCLMLKCVNRSGLKGSNGDIAFVRNWYSLYNGRKIMPTLPHPALNRAVNGSVFLSVEYVKILLWIQLWKVISVKAWSLSNYRFACSHYCQKYCLSIFCLPGSFSVIYSDFLSSESCLSDQQRFKLLPMTGWIYRVCPWYDLRE